MKFTPTAIKDVILLEPQIFGDRRGFFMETFRRDLFRKAGITPEFVQWNHSRSVKNTLRGLHFQVEHPQGKLVRVVLGEVCDVAVDVRPESPTFGKWVSEILSDQNRHQLYVPPGFAHGFCVLSDAAEFIYGIAWNDPDLGIRWPVENPILSDKDARYPAFAAVARELRAKSAGGG